MEKIKFITDSASDIPEEEARAYGIEVLPIPIALDGKDYHERVDFTNREFYKLLTDAARIPVTSHIPHTRYAEVYRHAAEDGYRKIINVTINSKGSNMFAAANMGRDLFAEEYPELAQKTQITGIDSLCYTYTYGYAVVQAAQQAEVDFATGKLTSTHELAVIEQKANLALQYTVAIKNQLLSAYKEIMTIQV